jgi:hypothetical protein
MSLRGDARARIGSKWLFFRPSAAGGLSGFVPIAKSSIQLAHILVQDLHQKNSLFPLKI